MMLETDFKKYAVDIRRNEAPPIGLTYLDVAKKGPLPALLRTSETSVKERHRNFKRDPNLIYAKGALLGRDRKTGLVRLLSRKSAEFDGIAGVCEPSLEADVSYVRTRGEIILSVEREKVERRKKMYVLDFKSFTLDESVGGWHL